MLKERKIQEKMLDQAIWEQLRFQQHSELKG